MAGLDDRNRRDPLPFDEWWTTPVLKDMRGNAFGRREFVLGLAHMDGGAHVDPELKEAYAALSRENSFGFNLPPGRRAASRHQSGSGQGSADRVRA